MEFKMSKQEMIELKSMSKFTGKTNSHTEYLMYNSKEKRFEATNGKVAILVSHDLELESEDMFKVTLVNDYIILSDSSGYPYLERVFPTSGIVEFKDYYIHSGKTEVIDQQLSIFMSKLDMILNYKYLLNLPKCDVYKYFVIKRTTSQLAYFEAHYELGKARIVIMPIIEH